MVFFFVAAGVCVGWFGRDGVFGVVLPQALSLFVSDPVGCPCVVAAGACDVLFRLIGVCGALLPQVLSLVKCVQHARHLAWVPHVVLASRCHGRCICTWWCPWCVIFIGITGPFCTCAPRQCRFTSLPQVLFFSSR